MTTTTVNLSPGEITNLCAPGAVGSVQATNTATVTPLSAFDYVLVRVRIIDNADTDAPTVLGSGTVTVTIVDNAAATALTSGALTGVFNTTSALVVPTDFVFAVSNQRAVGGSFAPGAASGLGAFTVVTTVAAGDTDSLVYQVDAVAVPTELNRFVIGSGKPTVTATGSEKPQATGG